MDAPRPPSAPPLPEVFERCVCTGVDRALVLAAICRERPRSFDALRRASGACYGCQSCRPELEALLAQSLRAEAPTDRHVRRPDPPVPGAPQG